RDRNVTGVQTCALPISRALFVLKNAGLIKLKKGKTLVTVADITSNPNNYKIKEIGAEQTGRVLNSVDASVVNNDYAGPAGLTDKQTITLNQLTKIQNNGLTFFVSNKANKRTSFTKM